MLSTIIDASEMPDRTAGLLAALTSGAVEGLVRDVLIVGGACDDTAAEVMDALCDATGAELANDFAAAIAQARGDWLLAAPATFRPRGTWIEDLQRHLRDGGGAAVLKGEGGGFFRRAPQAVLIQKAKAAGLVHPDLNALRRKLGPGALRIG